MLQRGHVKGCFLFASALPFPFRAARGCPGQVRTRCAGNRLRALAFFGVDFCTLPSSERPKHSMTSNLHKHILRACCLCAFLPLFPCWGVSYGTPTCVPAHVCGGKALSLCDHLQSTSRQHRMTNEEVVFKSEKRLPRLTAGA